MITIDQNKCNHCAMCINICHEYCISSEEGLLKIDTDYCSTCSQCIAVCPQEALSWNDIQPTRYNRDLLPDPTQMDELFRERRTIRNLKEKKVDRDLLKEIVRYTAYAPTHNFDMRVIIIDDNYLISQIDHIIYRYNTRIYNSLYKPEFMHSLVKTTTPDREREYLKAKPKLEASMKRKRNFRTIPPAIIMIVADRRIPLSLESAQYALHTINLYAMTKGLGCWNLVGNQMLLNRSSSLKDLIGLKSHEKIFGTMAIGYPAIKFRNKVNGKEMQIQWNN